MMNKNPNVEWEYRGKTDLMMGTDASSSEKWIGWISFGIVPLFLLYISNNGVVDWNVGQLVLVLVLAIDVGGGAVCNSLNSAKRFYHSSLKLNEGYWVAILKQKMVFVLLHIHTIIVWIIFQPNSWVHGVLWYLLLLLFALILQKTPLYIRRPISILLIMIAILTNYYLIEPVPGLEWLVPLLFIKILYGRLVQEEPYRKS